jgi:hypothetical protein
VIRPRRLCPGAHFGLPPVRPIRAGGFLFKLLPDSDTDSNSDPDRIFPNDQTSFTHILGGSSRASFD